ncbi:MAG: hypothetical protein QXF56_04625 [Candidatus Micrarchaeia archaeon]
MDETTFRILSTSTILTSSSSISSLTNTINKLHGTAYYKNVYDKLRELEKNNIINITRIGRTSIPSINFNNYVTIDLLAEVELRKKQNFLEEHTEMLMLFSEMDTHFNEFCSIKSILIINPEKNIKLNRAEFLFLLKNKSEETENEITEIHLIMQKLQRMHNLKLDCLVLKEKEFIELLKSEDGNPLKEMLSDKIAFFAPQAFWLVIRAALSQGIQLKPAEETNPAEISETDLIYNLSRFGYKEIGLEIKEGRKICIETIITSLLLQSNSRRIDAIPVLLAKNKANYNLLLFLCKKYNRLEKLLGLIKVLKKIKSDKTIEGVIRMLERIGVKGEDVDERSIKQKMRLYNAI